MRQEEQPLLMITPILLLYVWIEVVVPSFTTLLSNPPCIST